MVSYLATSVHFNPERHPRQHDYQYTRQVQLESNEGEETGIAETVGVDSPVGFDVKLAVLYSLKSVHTHVSGRHDYL